MTDHQHLYPMGDPDPACHICGELRSASDLDVSTVEAIDRHRARAVRLLRDEIQRIEDEAADRLHHAEWKDGA